MFTDAGKRKCTFGVGPVGIEVWQSSLIADLLESFGRFVVDLENAARPPPTTARIPVSHFMVSAPAPRGVVARVKSDGALEEDWGRQLGGIAVTLWLRKSGQQGERV